MVMKHPLVLVIGLILLAGLVAAMHYFRARWAVRYQGGVRAANTEYVRALPEYRRMMLLYRILSILLEGSLVTAAIAGLVLAARPSRTETIANGVKKRDIFLCLDVSYSIYQLNYDIADYLIEVVRGLEGDRFGICIFNTSSVVYVPMTDDYDFVISKLEDLKTYFHLVKDYVDTFGQYNYYSEIPEDQLDYFEQLTQEMDYEEAGTLINNRTKGSSLIGEGLASCLFSFPRLEESDRTRVVIMATDNWQEERSAPLIELDEAASLCASHDVKVYGVFPERDDLNATETAYYETIGKNMEEAVTSTGGVFYRASSSFPVSEIITGIQAEEAKEVDEIMITRSVDQPQTAVRVLLVSLLISVITGMVLRKW